jgi:hypothetical protein
MVNKKDCGKTVAYVGPGSLENGLKSFVPAAAFDVNESAKNFLLALEVFLPESVDDWSMFFECDSCVMKKKKGCAKNEDLRGVIACMLEKGRFMVIDTEENLHARMNKK